MQDLTGKLRQIKTNSLCENKGGERVEEVMEEGAQKMIEAFNNNLDYSLFGKFVFWRELDGANERVRSTSQERGREGKREGCLRERVL